MPTQRFCQISSFWKACFSTYGSFLLIGRSHKYILDLHHRSYGNNLFGAAKVSWLEEHLREHGAEGKLRHPQTRGISQTAVMVQPCQQICMKLRFCILCKDASACKRLPTHNLAVKGPFYFKTLLTTRFLTCQSVEQLQSLNHGLSRRRLLKWSKRKRKIYSYLLWKSQKDVRIFKSPNRPRLD